MELLICIILVVCIIPMLCFVALGIYSDKKERRYVLYGGREFNCYCTSEFSGRMCCVSIYEIMPNRRIFKEKYRCYKTFWISDFETIKEGVYAMINSYIIDEEEANLVNDKWKELDNGN